MPFKVNSDTATATATSATVPAAIATPPATGAKTEKTDLRSNLTALKATLSASNLSESKDITLAALAGVDETLARGIQAIAQGLGFNTRQDAIALRYIPQSVSDEGQVKEALLILFSVVSNPNGSCDIRWVNERAPQAPDGNVYVSGLRLGGDEPSVVLEGYIAPMVAMVRRDLPPEEKKKIAVCDSFAELAPYLAAGGVNIVSDPVDGYLLFVESVETRKSAKGRDYTLILGQELNLEDSTPQGEAALFSPVPESYWGERMNEPVVIQFSKEGKCFSLLRAADGSVLDTLPLGGTRSKLKDLEQGSTWAMVGTKQTTSEEYDKGWIVRLVQKGADATGEVVECYANSKISNFIDANEDKIIEAAGIVEKAGEYPILDFQNIDQPFATLTILNHEKLSGDRVKVNLVIDLHLSDNQKTEQQKLLAKLGLL